MKANTNTLNSLELIEHLQQKSAISVDEVKQLILKSKEEIKATKQKKAGEMIQDQAENESDIYLQKAQDICVSIFGENAINNLVFTV